MHVNVFYKFKQYNSISVVAFGVLTAVIMKSSMLWDITPCRIWGSHSGDYEKFYAVRNNAV
jgi:hypothetical protein